MRLFKGEITDTLAVNQPENSWADAMNWVFDIDALYNEDGFTQGEYFSDFTQIGELVLPDNSILAFLVDSSGNNRVYKSPDGITGASLVTNLNFGFSKSYPIRAEAKYTNNLDIEVVFTDNYNPPRHITIDKDTEQIIESSLGDTKLFPNVSIPNFSLISVDAGGFLDKGSYYVTIAYNFGDDAYTNWIGMSNQVILRSDGQGFTIVISDIDTNFDSFKVGLIKVKDDTVVLAEQSNIDYNISTSTKTITIIGGGQDISPSGIVTKSISYDKVGDLTALEGRLYLAKLYRNAIIDYQLYANAINIEPIYSDLVALDTDSGSYADPIIIFDKVGFQDNEIYAFYIRWYLLDGTIGGDFFIPSQAYNSMSYHNNDNEEYPSGKGYPAGNVRHHLFPKKAASDFLSGTTGGPVGDAIRDSGVDSQYIITADVLHGVKFAAAGNGNLGTVSNDPNTTYTTLTYNTVTFANTLDITVEYDVNLEVVLGGTEDVTLNFEIWKNETAGGGGLRYWSEFAVNATTAGTHNLTNTASFNMSVAPGDTLTFRAFINITTGVDADVTAMELDWGIFIADVLPSTDANYFTKPTGIKVTNIVVPTDIASKVQGYQIMYASRNGTNSKVLGQSILYPDTWITDNLIPTGSKMRFHSFDILLDKPRIYPTDIQGQYTLGESNAASASKYTYIENTIGTSSYSTNIVQARYVPGDNVAASNDDGEEAYTFVVSTGTTSTNRILTNLYSTKTDYYLGLEAQILQATGVVHKVTTSGTYSINKLYGGDSYTCLYDVRLTKKRPTSSTDTYVRNAVFPVQSRYNVSLREWGKPYYQNPGLVAPNWDDIVLAGLESATFLEQVDYAKKWSNYFEYDKAFSFGNKFIQGKIQGDQIEDYPFRIVRSPEQNLESKTSSWRTFLSNDYYEQNRERGIINNIDVIDTDKLIIHHTNGLFVTNAKERLATDTTEIVIGVGELFDFAPKEVVYTRHGYLGSVHKFANFVCPLGYVFVSNGSIYTLSKSELKELTTLGKSKFFRDALDTGDNPYLQDKTDGAYVGGISMAWDDRYKRLLVSVNEFTTSYTKSYSRTLGAWVCGHTYTDGKLFNTGKKVYSFYNNRIFIHNSSSKCIYYDGLVKDSTIRIVANRQAEVDKVFENVNWKLTGLPNERNFASIAVTSDLDTTGTITIVPYVGDGFDHNINTKRKHSTFYFNELMVNDGILGEDNLITGLYALIDLSLDNTAQDEVAIIDIDYNYQIVDVQ